MSIRPLLPAALGTIALTGSLAVGLPATAAPSTPTVTPPAAAAPAAPTRACSETPVFAGKVPTPSSSLGFDLGTRKASVDQVYRYLNQVDLASDKVTVGTFGRTATGAPLKYALVGRPDVLWAAQSGRLTADVEALRNPRTPAATAAAIAARSPLILWVAGNVHGNEPASTDAEMRLIHELADRTDCGATDVLANALVVVVPIQNPDGRNANTRANAAAFDMNRDWFARTQPETRAKQALLAKFPPHVFVDQHGMGGKGYYFPPNADPIFHETARQPLGWIDDIAGKASAEAFRAKGYAYETWQAGFDLFYPGYGDTYPVLRHGAAGMTHEVGQAAPFADQVDKHFTAGITALRATARARQRINTEYHQQFVEAQAQGRACTLQPNHVDNPGNTVQRAVPDVRVCGYFVRNDDPGRRREVATLVSRLQQDGVEVHTLQAPAHVPGFKAYGKPAATTVIPAGSYWIPMAQGQKHWIQTMLGEDTYVPFPYFYDVSGWSMPLLQDVSAGSAPVVPAMRTTPTPRVSVPRVALPAGLPNVGVLTASASPFNPNQSTGWLQWRLRSDWRIPSTTLQASQITASTLAGLDVLIVPNIDGKALNAAMGTERNAALATWVRDGGRLVTWKGGTQYAALAGLSSAVLKNPANEVPGALVRATAPRSGPLMKGAGSDVWTMYEADPIMTAGRGEVVLSYPRADSPAWAVSGFAKGVEEIAGSTALVDEQVGQGRVTAFSFEPNFRAFTDGTASLVRNAIVDSRGTLQRSVDAPGGRNATAAERRRAGIAATKLDRQGVTARMDDRSRP
ncbi:M14 family zinc carboxypeptidase [Mobilicoccus massiliensis]|uniref:M14 family zinc carboxypeptidase n=1 Tax=Mobilicoccus massiliensis TaxID=1522310 RepID=UPI00058F7711|nr:M14 family zinc carboxypeptidase [Mobilicoccus massiliensis]